MEQQFQSIIPDYQSVACGIQSGIYALEHSTNRRIMEHYKQYFDMGIRYNRSLIIGEKWQPLQITAGQPQMTPP